MPSDKKKKKEQSGHRENSKEKLPQEAEKHADPKDQPSTSTVVNDELSTDLASLNIAGRQPIRVTPDIIAYVKPKNKKMAKDADTYQRFKDGEDISDDDSDSSEYENDDSLDELQIKFQKKTEKTFFNPLRTKSAETQRISRGLYYNRVTPPTTYPTGGVLQAWNNPARRFVTAERAALKCSIQQFKRTAPPHAKRSSKAIGWMSNLETIGLSGNQQVRYRQVISPYPNHLGNYEFEVIGAYSNIIRKLNEITRTNKETEQKIAEQMCYFTRHGKPITNEVLTNLSPDDIKFLNHLTYHLFIKETTRWMCSTDDDCKFPATAILSYILELLVTGKLRFEDVFSDNAEYNPLTNGFIFKKKTQVWEEVKKLNRLYSKKVLKEHARAFNPGFFKIYESSKIRLIATPEYLHKQLRSTYGGDTDSGGEDYDQLIDPDELRGLNWHSSDNWYTSDEMNSLLNHYITDDGVRVMTAIDLTQHAGNTLQANLEQVHFDITLQESIGLNTRTIVLPILINRNHWVAVMIHFATANRNSPVISYFDPLGDVVPNELSVILQSAFPTIEPIINPEIRFQWDNYNCGPWIVEILNNLINSGCLPDEHFDIEAARQVHQQILNPISASSKLVEEPTTDYEKAYNAGRKLLAKCEKRYGSAELDSSDEEFDKDYEELCAIIDGLRESDDENAKEHGSKLAEEASHLQRKFNNNSPRF